MARKTKIWRVFEGGGRWRGEGGGVKMMMMMNGFVR
jgi:hypothetical protein